MLIRSFQIPCRWLAPAVSGKGRAPRIGPSRSWLHWIASLCVAYALGTACFVAHAQGVDVFGQPVGASSTNASAPRSALIDAPAHVLDVPRPVRELVGMWLRMQAGWSARIEDFLGQGSRGTSLHAWLILLSLSFAYGVLHAFGPGHGKLVVSTYLGSRRARVADALLLSAWTATVQALSAIGLVLGAAWLTRAGIMSVMPRAASLEIASYFLLCIASAWAIWSSARRSGCCDTEWAVSFPRGAGSNDAPSNDTPDNRRIGGEDPNDGSNLHEQGTYLRSRLVVTSGANVNVNASVNVDGRAVSSALTGTGSPGGALQAWLPQAFGPMCARLAQIGLLGLAAGMRPCVGAIFALVTSLGAHAIGAGIGATFAMAAGVAMTVTLFGIGSVGTHRILARVALRYRVHARRAGRVIAIGGVLAIFIFSALQLALLLDGIATPSLS